MNYMYINKSNKLDYRARLGIVKRLLAGWSVSKIARQFDISRQAVYDIRRRYRKEDVYGLEDHKPGCFRVPLNPSFYANVVELRGKHCWGACRIERYFMKKGFVVSHNKINQVIQYECLTRKKMGKHGKPKYVRYEAENINDQWHVDWSRDPLTKKNLFAVLDDKSRFVVFAGLFDSANAENTVIGLRMAIERYGHPKEIVSDNGSHFKNIHQRTVNKLLKDLEKEYGIKHIFIRAGHPQSNGKIERWFGSYKGEFPLMNHPDVTDCLSWVSYYNHERLHQSLDYDTPADRYLGCQVNTG